MGTMIQDLRFGWRQLAKYPGFTAVALVTLALGIGANSAMFSVVNAVLLRPLPFPQPDRLVAIGEYDVRHGIPRNADGSVSYPNMADLRARNRTLADVAVYGWSEATLTGSGQPHHVALSRVNAGLFN